MALLCVMVKLKVLKQIKIMTKAEAIEELEELLHYWRDIKFYNNKSEQEAVEFAIEYMKEN